MNSWKLFLFVILITRFEIAGHSQTANPEKYKYVFTVAKDGSGDFRFIQDAIDAMRVFPLAPITLYIRKGIYNEKINLPMMNTDVRFIGEDVDSTIIIFNDYSGRGKTTTFTSSTAHISGNRFYAKNISFVNNAGRVGQAVALHVDADQALFENCRFIGNQDTIYLGGENSHQYFLNCYIEGTTDFIFGPATALFENCTIQIKADSYITAASTPAGHKFGFVFSNCKIETGPEVNAFYLGRPWRAFSRTVFLGCELPAQTRAAGWDNWDNPENEKTTFYGEFQSRGAGADTLGRVGWSHQLTKKEATTYSRAEILGSASVSNTWFEHPPQISFQWPEKK